MMTAVGYDIVNQWPHKSFGGGRQEVIGSNSFFLLGSYGNEWANEESENFRCIVSVGQCNTYLLLELF